MICARIAVSQELLRRAVDSEVARSCLLNLCTRSFLCARIHHCAGLTMQELIVRRATDADLPTLYRFEQGVIEAERPFDPTLKPEGVNYYDLPALMASPDAELLVAEFEGELIGSGYARLETSKPYLKHSRHAYLGFMYVEPSFRGMGVNRAILRALEAWSLSRGVSELRLDVYADNSVAARAYASAGFAPLLIEMRKSVT
jgi:GNAT superfamily N-acetyltransferase